ncbi:MAG TPA: alpha/beta fold hydrolase [Rudaea sp.]|jgi:polyhydroxyalkanoate synthase|uniref:alpha/beta fold hydrolase n=1 Tax=Rudaea sp. TaxID=2136325 RepID=UPI002F93CAC9
MAAAKPRRATSPRSAAKAKRESSVRTSAKSAADFIERTVDNVLGQNVLGDFRPGDLFDTAGLLARQASQQPLALAKASLGFFGELGKLASGESSLAPEPGDRRFTDPAWQESKFHSGLLQSYLALRQSMTRYAKNSSLDERQAERAQFLLSQVGDALAPSNFLFGNPVALRKVKETRGLSLVRGAKNLIGDVLKKRPIPSQVDEKAFTVGGNLAVTPGSVVLRTEMFELIQYAPQTAQVRERPILVVPSIVNKFYVFDLAPGRSIFEHFIKQGLSVFVIVWRNPQRRHDRWGMPEYQDAVDAAVDATCAIAKVKDVNLWAVCGAGPVAVALAGYYAAAGRRKIHSLMLVVSPLDMSAMSQAPGIGAFVDKQPMPTPQPLKKALRKQRMSAKEFTVLFAMLRANELIWHYWVSNYLLGNSPSAFDVLYWNSDGTGMTAQFNHDFAEFVEANPFVTPGAMKVHGKAIADLAKLGIDSYVLGAANDHLCIWQGVYRSAQLLGKRSQFVLGNSGHIQTIVCPPGNPKASFCTNKNLPATAEAWLQSAERHPGSWWDHCVAWTTARAGALVRAPKFAGNKKFPPLCAAPGVYVHERV